jgi:hypothetical protein
MIARGKFDVKMTPAPAEEGVGGPFGRFILAKYLHGDIEGESHGQMLGAETAVKGSAAYVALELVTGTLHGKRGSFMLQHRGTMKRAEFNLEITVVPDSGTEELTGIAGTFAIIFEGKDHAYQLDYTLAESS